MAKYNDTKFYWLQLKEDFFEDDAIQWLEEQEPNGRDYAYFYLKLCLKSLKSNGVLIRKVGNILIPYDNKKLAELTKIDFDTVTVAMELLKQIGLVTILETGEIYINQLENLIGSKSIGAFKKQQQRLLRGQKEDKCPPKIELEIEKEIDIDINIEQEQDEAADNAKNLFIFLESNFGRTISPIEYERLIDWQKTFNDDIIKYAIELSCNANAKNMNYLNAILNNWNSKGYTKLQECKDESLKKQNKWSSKKPIRKELIPEWLDQDIQKEEMSPEELAELEAKFEVYKHEDEEKKEKGKKLIETDRVQDLIKALQE